MWEIKGLEETDLPRIADLELAIFPDAWSLPALRESRHQKSRTWLGGIWLDGLLIGYVIFYYVLDEGEIARIAVDPAHRRKGAAARLLHAVEDFCEEKGIDRLMLEVRKSNVPAISFYREYGFAEDGIRKNYYKNPVEDAVLMSRKAGI